MRRFTEEDVKGIEVEESWINFDVFAAVAAEIHQIEFRDNGSKGLMIKKRKSNRSRKSDENQEESQEKKDLVSNNGKILIKKRTVEPGSEVYCDAEEQLQQNKKSRKNILIIKIRRKTTEIPNDVPRIVIPPPELPEPFKNMIMELSGGRDLPGEMKLNMVIQKTLFKTDTSDGHNRLSIPVNQIKCKDLLNEDEKKYLQKRDEKTNKKDRLNFMEVKIIEPSLVQGVVHLRMWEMNCVCYALTGTWKSIVKRNGLKEGQIVQLWAFRVEEELRFALVRLP